MNKDKTTTGDKILQKIKCQGLELGQFIDMPACAACGKALIANPPAINAPIRANSFFISLLHLLIQYNPGLCCLWYETYA
jgi:hypothetical protein